MKWLIGIMVLSVVGIAGVQAQDGDRAKRMAEIRKLEQRAEKLLDAGRRAEAFDALARAAVLRDNLKKSGKAEQKPKSDAKARAKGKKRGQSDFRKASDALSKAYKADDMAGLRRAAMHFQTVALKAEKRHREERAERARLVRRLEQLEAQIAALKKLMDS